MEWSAVVVVVVAVAVVVVVVVVVVLCCGIRVDVVYFQKWSGVGVSCTF